VAFAAAIVYAFESVVGMDFLNGSVALSTWFFEGGSDARILPFASGLTALPNFVAGGNPVLLGIMFLGSVSWYILWLILGLYIFSRYALSFSLDRLFPKWLGNVTRRTHQPWAGILVISAIGAILLPLVAYNYATVYNPFVFLLFLLPMVTVALPSLSLVRLGPPRSPRTGDFRSAETSSAQRACSWAFPGTMRRRTGAGPGKVPPPFGTRPVSCDRTTCSPAYTRSESSTRSMRATSTRSLATRRTRSRESSRPSRRSSRPVSSPS